MNRGHPLALIFAATMFMVACTSKAGSNTDARIEASARQTYTFRNHLKDDHIRIEARDGVVTLAER